jgi:YidC/Oxa1 family membrane protein insertase
MDRNSIFGIVLIVAILIVYGVLSKPSEKEVAQKRMQDSIAWVEKQRATESEIQKAISDSTKNKQSLINDTASLRKMRDSLGAFGNAIQGKDSLIYLENSLIKLAISTKGGRPYSVELKKYKRYDSLPVKLFDGDSTQFSLEFFSQNRLITTGNLYFKPIASTAHVVADKDSQRVSMRLEIEQGRYLEYVYTIRPNNYRVDLSINLVGLDQVIAQNQTTLALNWEVYSPRQEKGIKNENQYTELYYKYNLDEVDYMSASKEETKEIKNQLKWVAYKQQFFSTVLIAKDYFSYANLKTSPLPNQEKHLKRFNSELTLPLDLKEKVNIPLSFYFGPNHFQTLKKQGDDLKDLVSLGGPISRWINRGVIIPVFNFLGEYISNYGLIILLLTIIIKILLLPLTFKSYQSTARMKVLKPQVDEINAKIPKEKAMERQQATMALYKRAGVSPLGGCLPLLLQMPILFAMFKFFPTSIELRGQSFLWANDLSTYDSIFEWQRTIPILSSIYGNHISLFTILMTATTLVTIKMNDSTTSNQQMPGMKYMMYFMPVMFMFMLNNFSAGLTYYYFLANIITIGQNYLFKGFIDEQKLLKQLEENKKKPIKKSKFQARLEEISRQQQQVRKK